MPFCTACGQALGEGDRFCARCGTALAPPAAAPPSPSPPAPTEQPAQPAQPEPAEPTQPEPAQPEPAQPEPGPRWPVGSGPTPLPPRSPAARRAVIAVGLPLTVIAGGIVALLGVAALLSSGDSPSAVPRIVTPEVTTTGPTLPTTSGAPGPSSLTPTPSSPTPSITATTAREQAGLIGDLLDEAARTPVGPTVASLARCDAASADAAAVATTLSTDRTARSRLLQRLQALPVDQLRDGEALRTSLRDTWDQWVTADQQYLVWARGIASGAICNPQDPFKLAGDVAAANAGRSATAFVAAWNADVAGPLRLPARQGRNL
jgi:hypothetical protein